MNLTKERVKALESSMDIKSCMSDNDVIVIELIQFWNSKQPKKCRNCGQTKNNHTFSGNCVSDRHVMSTRYEIAK